MALALRYTALSDVGRVRTNNEDSGYAGPHLLVVADGMGGAAAGEVASSAAVDVVSRLDQAPAGDLKETLAGAVHRANDRIADLMADDPETEGMGTTLTVALFDGGRLGLAHVGDSRAYLLRDGRLSRLTHDHTFVQTLVDEGRISEPEARVHPHRSLMLRALDGSQDMTPDLTVHELRAGDRLLLCSDGLNGFVDDDPIASTLAAGSIESAAVNLVRAALDAGGHDNVTCIVGDVLEEPDAGPGEPLLVGAAAERPRPPTSREGPADTGPDTADLEPISEGEPDEDVEEQLRYAPRPPERFRLVRRVALTVFVLAVLAGAALGGYVWTQQQYFVTADGDNVAIYRGVQADLPGIELSRVWQVQELPLRRLPPYLRDRVQAGIGAPSLGGAERIVADLERIAQECAAVAQAGPSPGTVPTPTTPTDGPTPTAGTSANPAPGPTPSARAEQTPVPTGVTDEPAATECTRPTARGGR